MNPSLSAVSIRDTQFDNDGFTGLGIELLTLAELRGRVPPERLLVPERLDFYMALVITHGVGAHMVDFVTEQLSPGSVVLVRPGQVQQWFPGDSLEGTLVLITVNALFPETARSAPLGIGGLAIDEWPAVTQLPQALMVEIDQAMGLLRQDFERFNHSALDVTLIRHGVRGFLMRIGRWLVSQSGINAGWSGDRRIYRLFIRNLENRFHQRFGVTDYAALLGYSASTLSRACLAAEGRSAKQVIDRRVALEAARSLVHSQLSVAEIGYALGFSEATNFVKFFRRMNGMSPQAFRREMATQGQGERSTGAAMPRDHNPSALKAQRSPMASISK